MTEYKRMVNGVEVPLTEDEITQRKAEEAEAAKPKEKPATEQGRDLFFTLPVAEMLKPENAVPFLLAELANRHGKAELIPAIIAAAKPTPEAGPVKDKISEKFQ